MSQIQAHQADFLGPWDAVNFTNTPFDISFWFNSYYFVPQELAQIILARVVANTQKGGIICSDLQMLQPERSGLRQLQVIKNIMHGDKVSAFVYQKVADLSDVRVLAQLEV